MIELGNELLLKIQTKTASQASILSIEFPNLVSNKRKLPCTDVDSQYNQHGPLPIPNANH